jgi:hypothetical protein
MHTAAKKLLAQHGGALTNGKAVKGGPGKRKPLKMQQSTKVYNNTLRCWSLLLLLLQLSDDT